MTHHTTPHTETETHTETHTRAPVAPTQSAWESAHDIDPGDLLGIDFSDCLPDIDW